MIDYLAASIFISDYQKYLDRETGLMEVSYGVFAALVLTAILSVSAEVLNLSEELEEDGYFRKEHSLTKPYTGNQPVMTMTRSQP